MRFFVEKKTEKRRFPYEGKFLRNDESRFCNIIFLPKGRLKKIRVEKGEVLGSFLFFFFGNKFGILKLEARRTKLISSLKCGRIFWRGNMPRGLEDEVFFTLRSFGNNDYEITRVI